MDFSSTRFKVIGALAIVLSALCYLFVAFVQASPTPLLLGRPLKAIGLLDVVPVIYGKNLRIMPLGDSITMGWGSEHGNGYRRPLLDMLRPHNNTVHFVGMVESGDLEDHFTNGFYAWPIRRISEKISPTFAYRPNVILLYAGINDMRLNITEQAPAALQYMLDEIYNALPDVTVLVSNLQFTYDQPIERYIIDFNKTIKRIVEDRAGKGQHIALVDLHSEFANKHGYHQNRLHPNNRGYEVLARTWYNALSKLVHETDWISAPDPPTIEELRLNATERRKICMTGNPDFVPQGEVFDGAGFGASYVPGASCTVNEQDSDRCDCDYLGYGVTVPLVGEDCTAMSRLQPHMTHFADVNGDGLTDILQIGSDTVTFHLQRRSNEYEASGTFDLPPQAPRHEIQFADVNGDGFADMLWVLPNGSVQIWLNNHGTDPGTITFARRETFDAPFPNTMGANVRIVDINGDSYADYAVIDDEGGVNMIYNSGNATHTIFRDQPHEFTNAKETPSNHDRVQFGDIGGDGTKNYIIVNMASGDSHFWNWNWEHQRLVGETKIKSTFDNGVGVQFVDMNGDGRADMVQVDPETSAVSVWRNRCPSTRFNYKPGQKPTYDSWN